MKLGLSIILGLTMTAMIAACGDSKSGGAAPAVPPTAPGTVVPNANTAINAREVLTITNRDQYKKFVEDWGYCSTILWGTCSYHDDHAEIGISTTTSTFTNGVATGSVSIFVFQSGLTGGGMSLAPVILQPEIRSINGDTGFEIRRLGAFGTYAYNKYTTVRVDSGRLTDQSVLMIVLYNNIEIGRANVRLH